MLHARFSWHVLDPRTLPRPALGRLYLLSDVLHNSRVTAKGAWNFRQAIERRLPDVLPAPASNAIWTRWMAGECVRQV